MLVDKLADLLARSIIDIRPVLFGCRNVLLGFLLPRLLSVMVLSLSLPATVALLDGLGKSFLRVVVYGLLGWLKLNEVDCRDWVLFILWHRGHFLDFALAKEFRHIGLSDLVLSSHHLDVVLTRHSL